MVGELDKSEFKPNENYDEFYAGHKFEPFPEALAFNADEVLPRVGWALDVAKEIGATNVLDLCCLDGFASLTLAAKLTISAFGIDLSEPGIKLANQRALSGNVDAKYVQGAIEASALAGKYDLVLLFEAIEHFKNVDAVIRIIKDSLKPGGTLLVSTPDADGRFGIENVEDICHLRVYTHKKTGELPEQTPEKKPIVSIPDYLESQGFTVVENEVWNELIHIRATLKA